MPRGTNIYMFPDSELFKGAVVISRHRLCLYRIGSQHDSYTHLALNRAVKVHHYIASMLHKSRLIASRNLRMVVKL